MFLRWPFSTFHRKARLLWDYGLKLSESGEVALVQLHGQWILELAAFGSLEIYGDNRLWWVLTFLPRKAHYSQRKAVFLPRPCPPWDDLLVGVGAELPSNAGGAASRGQSNPVLFFLLKRSLGVIPFGGSLTLRQKHVAFFLGVHVRISFLLESGIHVASE